MTDEVASHFSFKGQYNIRMGDNRKLGYRDTRLHAIVYDTVNLCFPDAKLTAENYKRSLEDWFSQAPFRKKRRCLNLFLNFCSFSIGRIYAKRNYKQVEKMGCVL